MFSEEHKLFRSTLCNFLQWDIIIIIIIIIGIQPLDLSG